MIDWCAARTRDEAIAQLEAARIPCGPVYDLGEVLDDPQVRARNLLEEVEYPGGGKPIPVAATPVRLGETLSNAHRRAPTLGEHTDEVLAELGFGSDEVAAFRNEGVI
jgi:crotonobetainyl-CoA:carnitine CoA-transferase CaiB-like acyl-CoA transferase